MTQIRTLLNGMAANSFKLLSLSSESTSMANALPRTRANFDYDFGVNGVGANNAWASDAAIGGTPMAGLGEATNLTEMWAFSGAAISEQDGKCMFFGGGHTDSGDGSIYTFDPEAAAANVNLGGSGIAWALAVPGARFIDAFVFGRPSSATSPEGAIQGAPTTPTTRNQSYWLMPNKNGTAMMGPGHSYHFCKYLPGSRNVILSTHGGFDQGAPDSPNACFVFNDNTLAITGPLVSGAAFPTGGGQTDSYVQLFSGSGCAIAVNPVDGLPYAWIGANFASRIYKWTDPINSSIALVDTTAATGSFTPSAFADAVMLPDPVNAGQTLWFQHHSPQEHNTDANFLVFSGFNGGTPGFSQQTYGTGSITTNGVQYLHYAYDASRKVIWMTDGNHIFQITPSASGLGSWTIAQITGFTGNPPPDPTVIGSANVPSLQYVAAQDCLIHVQQAGVRVYKPTGWNPPVDIIPAQPYQPWYQLGPFLAQ